MKTINIFIALLLLSCSNDVKLREDLLNAVLPAKLKTAEYCKCAEEASDLKECIEKGNVAFEEINKMDKFFEEMEKQHGADNDVIADSYKERSEVTQMHLNCNRKYIDRGGEKWW